MTNELQIMDTLKSFIVSNLAAYRDSDDTSTAFQDREVILDSPDIDNMQSEMNVWIEPNTVDVEDFTTTEDEQTFNVKLCIVAKRDTSANLRTKVFHAKNAIYRMLRNNQDLGGITDTVDVVSYRYYPQLYDEMGIVGMDIDINVTYTTDWSI